MEISMIFECFKKKYHSTGVSFSVFYPGIIDTGMSDKTPVPGFLKLPVSKAAKTCRLPGCGLFCQMMGMGVVPVFAGVSLYLGVWFMSTQKKGHKPASSPLTSAEGAADNDDASEEDTKGLPIRWHHLQRGLLQLFRGLFGRHRADEEVSKPNGTASQRGQSANSGGQSTSTPRGGASGNNNGAGNSRPSRSSSQKSANCVSSLKKCCRNSS